MSADEASRALRQGQSVDPQKKIGRPHDPDSIRTRKPWEDLGISRTTWYQRRKEGVLTEATEQASNERQAAPLAADASKRSADGVGFKVSDVVDLNAAAALQSGISQLCQDKPLSMIALVLMNEVANSVLLGRPTIGKARRDVDAVCTGIRDLLETKIKQYPEWINDGKDSGGLN